MTTNDNSGSDLHRLRVVARKVDGNYQFTITDVVHNIVLGRVFRPADAAGEPPRLEVADILEQVGGAYRAGSVEIDLHCRTLHRQTIAVFRSIRKQLPVSAAP